MRKVKMSTNAIVTFIAPDDDAIGNKTPEAYDAYMESINTSHLELVAGIDPIRYFVRPMSTKVWAGLMETFKLIYGSVPQPKSVGADGEVSGEPEVDTLTIELNTVMAHRKLAEACIVGCTNHPELVGINEAGEFQYKMHSVVPGNPMPAALLDLLANDTELMIPMIPFLIKISTLKEEEKNR